MPLCRACESLGWVEAPPVTKPSSSRLQGERGLAHSKQLVSHARGEVTVTHMYIQCSVVKCDILPWIHFWPLWGNSTKGCMIWNTVCNISLNSTQPPKPHHMILNITFISQHRHCFTVISLSKKICHFESVKSILYNMSQSLMALNSLDSGSYRSTAQSYYWD